MAYQGEWRASIGDYLSVGAASAGGTGEQYRQEGTTTSTKGNDAATRGEYWAKIGLSDGTAIAMMAHTFATMRVSCRVWRDTFASASVVVAIVDSLFASARYFVANQARASLEKGLLMPDPLPRLLGQAQYALDLGSQGELGELLGASRRSGQRWAVGRASPSGPQFEDLVRRVYEVDKDLAAQLAAARQTTLLAMGVVAPSAPPFVPPADRVADSVLCAAAEAMDVSPRAIRPAIHAAFTRARELGLTVEAMEKALRGGAPTAAAADGKKKR